MKRRHALLAISAPSLAACGGGNDARDPTVEYQLAPTQMRADSLRIERQGGGQIDFVIRRAATSGVFDVHVATAGFRTLNLNVTITAAELATNTLQALEQVLDGISDIGGVLHINPLPTGTWLYAYVLVGGSQVRIANAVLLEALAPLQTAVQAKLPPD